MAPDTAKVWTEEFATATEDGHTQGSVVALAGLVKSTYSGTLTGLYRAWGHWALARSLTVAALFLNDLSWLGILLGVTK